MPCIGIMTDSELSRSMPVPRGPERSNCEPDSSQATISGCAEVWSLKKSRKKRALARPPGLASRMRNTLGAAAFVGASGGMNVTASTQSGTLCTAPGFAFCRRSIQALPVTGAVMAKAGDCPATIESRLTASCAKRVRAARISPNAKVRRRINWADAISAHPKLQTLRHGKYRGQNAVNDKANNDGNDNDDDRCNQSRGNGDGAIEFPLVNVCDRHHGLTKVPGLLAHCHHIVEQVREHLLRRKRGRKMRAVHHPASDFC